MTTQQLYVKFYKERFYRFTEKNPISEMDLEECWEQKSSATWLTQRSQGWRTTTPAFRVENGFCLPFLEGITLCANIPGSPGARLWAPRSPCSLQLHKTFHLVYCFSYLLWRNRPFFDPVCCKISIFNGQRCVKEACRSWNLFKIPLVSGGGTHRRLVLFFRSSTFHSTEMETVYCQQLTE